MPDLHPLPLAIDCLKKTSFCGQWWGLKKSGVNISDNRRRFWYAAPMIDRETIIAEYRDRKGVPGEPLALWRDQHTAAAG